MGVILSQLVKNRVIKHSEFHKELEFHLKNIVINGSKRGCSGFIRNPQNGVVVYINTDASSMTVQNASLYVRYAKDLKDYRGCCNRVRRYDIELLVSEVCRMLRNQAEWERELASFAH